MEHLQSNLSKPYLPSEKQWKHFDGQNIKDDYETGNASEKQRKHQKGLHKKASWSLQRLSPFHRILPLAETSTFLLSVAGTLPYL